MVKLNQQIRGYSKIKERFISAKELPVLICAITIDYSADTV